jgi:uncharacterized peroxidase-related enzyme
MTSFTVHTLDSAPLASQALLAEVKQQWGFVPNLQGILAESAPALEGYQHLFRLVGKSSFTPAEQQLVFLAVATFNECEYCTMGHTYLARGARLDETAIEAVRAGNAVPDRRQETLRDFATAVVRERGFVGDAAVDAFLAAGFTRAQILEVVLVAATKTISSYANHIAHTPKEAFMSDPAFAWHAPGKRQAA